MKRLLFSFLVVVFFIQGTALSRNTKTSILKKVEQITSKAAIEFDAGHYQKALDLYAKAHDLMPDPRITFAMVRCLEAMHRYKEALDMVNQGLGENPDPTLRARFESKKEFFKKKLQNGTLQLQIVPSGAAVEIDGRFVGKSPLGDLNLRAGEHNLKVYKEGYASSTQTIHINGGSVLKMKISLTPILGSINVKSTPAGAQVWIDGQLRAQTPANNLQLTVGTHLVEIKAAGMVTIRKKVQVSPSQTTTIEVVLSPKMLIKKGPWYKSWPGWTMLAVGIGTGVGGALLLKKAKDDHDYVNATIDAVQAAYAAHKNPRTITGYSQKGLQDKWDKANQNEKIGYALIATAGAATVTSVIFFITRVGVPENHENVGTKPMVMATPWGIGVSGSF